MSTVALCRVCLASNTKMHHIANTPYQEIFEKLATELCTADGRPETVCWVCLSALQRGRRLADTARAAQEILTQFSLSGIQLNEDTVSILDRNFVRKLAWTPIQTQSINKGHKDSPTEVEIKQEPSENYLTNELCDETQILNQTQVERNNTQVLLMLKHTDMDLAQDKQTGSQDIHSGCQTIFNIKLEELSYDEISEPNSSENSFSEIQTGNTLLTDVENSIVKMEKSKEFGMICDSDLNILNVDATFGGASHDAFIWRQSEINPHIQQLHSDGGTLWLLGDSGYPLRPWLLTPIVNAGPDTPEEHYTNVHCKVRNTVERCIGVIKARWRCLLVHRVLHYDHHTVAKIINACCVLHNMANRERLPVPELSPADTQAERNQQESHRDQVEDQSESQMLQNGRRQVSIIVQRLWNNRT